MGTNQSRELGKSLPELMEEMKAKIEEKEKVYGDFTSYGSFSNFTPHLREEIGELVKECSRIQDRGGEDPKKELDFKRFRLDYEAVKKESVDVANMAYFIWRLASIRLKNYEKATGES